ncbi:unnamed protein product [Cylindrotheca closterium]|uniref:HTH La-type RNA-binding domain-containing protein n=1 Tax=Cylindrotheca closterium TaxID=2856 RepID=A0AAD2G6I8_9STRA|nr:unnamed protein product [Cylindrotheca closterium]
MAESKSSEEWPGKISSNQKETGPIEAFDCPKGPANTMFQRTEPSTEILEKLARQVEYYFSATNLNKDTYVSTLRSLNDGYVPVTIIANFGKVRSLAPYDSAEAVRRASEEHSGLLEVVQIESTTGKRISCKEDQGTLFVQAVGPIGGEPIPTSKLFAKTAMMTSVGSTNSNMTVPVAHTSPAIQNTVVLREVPNTMQESDIRRLFTFEKCPSIQNMYKDVANCWFVTLDTISRDEMLEVMLALRQAKYPSGELVKARVKSGVVMNRDALASPLAFYSSLPAQTDSVRSNNSRKNKKRKNGKSRNNITNNSQNATIAVTKGKTSTSGRRRGNGTKSNDSEHKTNGKSAGKKGSSMAFPLLSLGGGQFPPLPSEFSQSCSNKVEVEKVPTHYELGRKGSANSDSSSTATTSTSSSKSPPLETSMGGYAAALRKVATLSVKDSHQETRLQSNLQTEKKKKIEASSATRNTRPPTKSQLRMDLVSDVDVKPPTWGHGSFAEILRTEETAQASKS